MSKELINELKTLRKERKDLNERISTTSRNILKLVVTELFEKNSNLQSIAWTQYTPYFNDGDECVFHAQTEYPTLVFSDGEDIQYSKSNFSEWDDTYKTRIDKKNLSKKDKIAKTVINVLENFEDQDLKEMFGDHAKIVISRDGIEVEEYSHD